MTQLTTEDVLARTLKQMMETTSFDHITIGKLADAAHINRNTFYYHFDDIYELLRWTYKQDILTQLQQYTQIDRWEHAYQLMLDYIEDNKHFCQESLRSVARDLLENFLYSVATGMIEQVVISVDANTPAKISHAITDFYAWAIVMQAIQWLDSDLEESKDDMIKKAEIVLNGTIANAISNGHAVYGV
ncbi:TetR/AcrR family transcriptional regulator [Lacticaseibacillus pantheris]|jgi:probable dihydroxyacetone kinase regulator|uniref:TetR/AcrR family transcriptional regulator n=1 Tax=Lacticaseibacillus pantheris TaxID=171523 RepID=UPI002592D226|nr:TetR-like C-terminal domain-containing protein [Lacticaseibacillus pantheris]WKF83971.1 TetR-like C-terminal domain-containing protein [Lacticaseibacillus pantheris]